MKFHTRRPIALAAIILTASAALTACGSDDGGDSGSDSGGDGGGELSMTMLPKNLGNPYFDTSDKGGKEAVAKFGGTFKEVGPDTASPDAQVPFINTAAQQGVKALVVSANDPKAIGSALNQARGAGTKVVTFDSDTEPQYRDLFVNQASAEGIAKVEVDMVTKQIKDSAADYARYRAHLHAHATREIAGALATGRREQAERLAAGWNRADGLFGALDARRLPRA